MLLTIYFTHLGVCASSFFCSDSTFHFLIMSYISGIVGRVPSNDIYNIPDALTGVTSTDFPTGFINVATTSNNVGSLTDYLQKYDKNVSDEEGMSDFLQLLDTKKTLWGIPEQQKRRSGVYVTRYIKISLLRATGVVNTGVTNLSVGSKLYLLPAIVPLAKTNVCNVFRYLDCDYVHPMMIDENNLKLLTMDLLDLKSAKDFTPHTHIARFIKSRCLHCTDDIDKILTYMTYMRPVGVIESNFKYNTAVVRVGGEFTLRANEFGV